MAGNIFGKGALSYTPDGNYTRCELKNFLKQFKLDEALRLIGMISSKFLQYHLDNRPKLLSYHALSFNIESDRYFKIGKVPINNGLLVYVTMCLIENAKNSNKKIFGLMDLSQAANMYYGLHDPFFENADAKESLIRVGASQFEYDLDWLSFLSRSLAIYREIWPTLSACSGINIEQEIHSLSGLFLDEIAFLSFWFSVDIGAKNITPSDDPRVQIFNKSNIDKFIKWLSCDYEKFKELSSKEKQQYKSDELNIYEKYRFNQLQNFPIVITAKTNQWQIPCVYLLYKRITQGLYHELGEKFKVLGDNTNPFRRAFGAAFEEYVGTLLRNSNPNFRVIKSPEYGTKKQKEKTVDWIVVEGDKAILIEVKQSGLYLKAKTTGEQKAVEASLKQTIADGVKQIIKFEENVKSGKFTELSCLQPIKLFERVVVTYDPIFFTAVLGKEVESILGNIPNFFYWHTMSIEQFEHIVGNKDLGLYEFLRTKRVSPEHKFQDFREYIAYTRTPINNDYLSSLWLDLFRSEKLRHELEFLTGKQLSNFLTNT